jgi:RHS repeat-associated protein
MCRNAEKRSSDPNDRLTNRWSLAMGATTYRYDPIGNLTNVDYSAGTVSTPSVSFAYDGLNRLTNMMDGIGTTTFGWTDGDQLASENGPWADDAVSYSYSDRLRISASLLQPTASPWTQGYGYDSVMRLSAVTSPAGGGIASPSGTFTYTYSGGGDRALSVQFPGGGLYVTNRYDSLARLTNTWLNSPLSGTVDLHQYSYDPGSEVTQQVFTAGNHTAYTYDNIGQLKTAQGFESAGGARLLEQYGYAYDAAWNLNSRTNNNFTQSFSVNDLNELSSAGRSGTLTVAGTTTEPGADITGVTVSGTGLSSGAAQVYADGTWARTNATPADGANSYTATATDTAGRSSSSSVSVNLPASPSYLYDGNGNLTNDGTRSFAYDDENQLVGAWVSGAWSNNFAYDGLNRKRIERDYSWNGSSWLETNEVHYVYDGNLVFQERDGNNLPVTTYTRGNDLSGDLQSAGGIGGLLARSDRMSVVPRILSPANPHPQNVSSFYYHSDGNGNVTALVEPNGYSVASYQYDPFGNMFSMSGLMAGANKYRFSSKEWNDNDGLYYYGKRFYDPNLQRWLNRDPIQESGGINLYDFVANDPLSLFDAYGHGCGDAVSTGVGAAESLITGSDAFKSADDSVSAQHTFANTISNAASIQNSSESAFFIASIAAPQNVMSNSVIPALNASSAFAKHGFTLVAAVGTECMAAPYYVKIATAGASHMLMGSGSSPTINTPKAPNPNPNPPKTNTGHLTVIGTTTTEVPFN